MNSCKSLLVFVLIVLIQGVTYTQEWISYQSPQQINDLVDTGDELIMATDAGLVVFNKETLEKTIFNKTNSNLNNNHIQSIVQKANGDFYIGTYDVIMSRFDGSGFQDIIIPESDAYNENTELYDFEIAENGDFWIGTSDGVFHKSGQNWSHYDDEELGASFFEAWDIEVTPEGDILVASHDIHRFSNGEWSNFSEGIEISAYNDAELFFSGSGDLFFAGDLEKIGRFDGNQWYEYDNGGLNGSEVIGFTEDTDGTVYFNTQRNGIFKFENDAWTPLENTQVNEFNNNTSFFYIDALNQHWLNYNIYLSVSTNSDFQLTSISSETIESNSIEIVRKGQNGDMFFGTGTSTNSIARLDTDGNWSSLQLPSDIGLWPLIGDILFLADDDIWIAASTGLYHYDGTDWEWTELESCTQFSMDGEGRIYVLSAERIYILENGTISEYNTSNSPISADLFLSGLGVDANNDLWIASFNYDGEAAIHKVDSDGNWTTFTHTDHAVLNQPIGDFHFDKDGNVWIPSGFAGAIKFDGTTWTNPISENIDELENYNAYSIRSDEEGRLYFSHQYGVTTLLDGEWEELFIEDVPNTNSSHRAYMEFDDKGTLWWGSSRYGVFSYTPETITSTFSDYEMEIDLSLYPNPAQNYFVLDFTIEKTSDVEIYIYDNLGQSMQSLNLGQLPSGAFQQSIALDNFVTGLYTVQLKIDNRFFTQRLIVE